MASRHECSARRVNDAAERLTRLNMGIFHRKAAKVAEERKETKNGGMKPDNHAGKATWLLHTLMDYDLCDPLRPLRLCGKFNVFR